MSNFSPPAQQRSASPSQRPVRLRCVERSSPVAAWGHRRKPTASSRSSSAHMIGARSQQCRGRAVSVMRQGDPKRPLEFTDRLAELQVHAADYLVVDCVADTLPSSRLASGRVGNEKPGLHHGLERCGDGGRREPEGVCDLATGGWLVFSEVANDAGADEVTESLDGILQPLAPSTRADRGSPRHSTHCAVARRFQRRSSGCLDYSLRLSVGL